MTAKATHRDHRRRADGPRHRAGLRASPAMTSPSTTPTRRASTALKERIAANLARPGRGRGGASTASRRSPTSPTRSPTPTVVIEAALGGPAAQAGDLRRARAPRAARRAPRQQHLGHPDRRDLPRTCTTASASLGTHWWNPPLPRAAGRGDRHAMDTAPQAIDAMIALLDVGRQDAGAREEGRAGLHRQPPAARAVARGDRAGRRTASAMPRPSTPWSRRASAAGSRCSARWRTPTSSAPISRSRHPRDDPARPRSQRRAVALSRRGWSPRAGSASRPAKGSASGPRAEQARAPEARHRTPEENGRDTIGRTWEENMTMPS